MTFVPKDWRNLPDRTTPVNRASLQDLEARVTSYGDLAGVKLSPGNLAATYSLDVATAKTVSLVGTLSANHTLTINNLTAGVVSIITVVQDSTGSRTFSITVNGVTTAHAVNSMPLDATVFLLVGVSTTDYVLVPLGA